MAELTVVAVDGALGEAKADRIDGARPSYWYDDESDHEDDYKHGGPDRAIAFKKKLEGLKKRILLENKRRYGEAFTKTKSSASSSDPDDDVDDDHRGDGDDHSSKKHDEEDEEEEFDDEYDVVEFDDDGFIKSGLVDDWDSEDDTRFDRADFVREFIIFIAASNPKECEDQFLLHYFTVCKSRGYDLDTVPPPKGMWWPVTEWLKPFPEEKYPEIEPVLKDQAFPVIREKSGKDLELEDIMVVNVWNRRHNGRFYYITFQAKDRSNGSKSAVYQTRLVLDPDPPRSLIPSYRLNIRVGSPGPVHAFRLKPNQTD